MSWSLVTVSKKPGTGVISPCSLPFDGTGLTAKGQHLAERDSRDALGGVERPEEVRDTVLHVSARRLPTTTTYPFRRASRAPVGKLVDVDQPGEGPRLRDARKEGDIVTQPRVSGADRAVLGQPTQPISGQLVRLRAERLGQRLSPEDALSSGLGHAAVQQGRQELEVLPRSDVQARAAAVECWLGDLVGVRDLDVAFGRFGV